MPFTAERLRSRHPFQLFMLLASAFYSGAGLLVHKAQPGTVRATVGEAGTAVWLWFVLIGSIAALVGVFWRDRATGLTAEQTGLLTAGAATVFYAVVAVHGVGLAALGPAAILFGFGAACLARSWQLHRLLRRVPRELRQNKGV